MSLKFIGPRFHERLEVSFSAELHTGVRYHRAGYRQRFQGTVAAQARVGWAAVNVPDAAGSAPRFASACHCWGR